jgi:hypothetical protein
MRDPERYSGFGHNRTFNLGIMNDRVWVVRRQSRFRNSVANSCTPQSDELVP